MVFSASTYTDKHHAACFQSAGAPFSCKDSAAFKKLVSGSMLVLTVFLASCGGEQAETQNPLNNAPSANTVQSSNKQDGGNILLASELVAANVNPFLNKLPITADVQASIEPPPAIDGGQTPAADNTPPPEPVDPFEGVEIVGIAYQPKNAYALLSLGSEGSQVVREGDVVTSASGSQLKITQITRDRVTINVPGGEKRTMLLPEIVGYQEKLQQGGGSSTKTPVKSKTGTNAEPAAKPASATIDGSAQNPETTNTDTKKSSSSKKPIIKLDE